MIRTVPHSHPAYANASGSESMPMPKSTAIQLNNWQPALDFAGEVVFHLAHRLTIGALAFVMMLNDHCRRNRSRILWLDVM